jgi:hypothetical protein
MCEETKLAVQNVLCSHDSSLSVTFDSKLRALAAALRSIAKILLGERIVTIQWKRGATSDSLNKPAVLLEI